MNRLDQDLAAAAKRLSGTDLTGIQAHSVLAELLKNYPFVANTGTIDRNAKMVALEPASYQQFEGSDISQQEQVIRLFRTQQPVLSNNFQTVQGIEAAVVEHPVFSPNGEIAGAIGALFQPEILLDNIIAPVVKGTTYAIWVMQLDGRLMYDVETSEVGTNLFVDSLYQPYPSLIDLGREISVKATGKGQYQWFLDTEPQKTVKKQAIWSTFNLHGTEWRLVLVQVIS